MFNENGISAFTDEGAIEMDGGEGCTKMGVYLMLLNCTLMIG